MKKKTLLGMAVLCMTVAMSACGSTKNIQSAEEETEVIEVEEEVVDEEDTEDLDWEEDFEEEAEEDTEETAPAAALGDYNLDDYTEDFVNFDEMAFYINGKKYVLGQTTLQEMIDDGVPFEEDDIAVASETLESHYQSQRISIVLDDYWNAQIYVFNETDEDKLTSECYINEIYFPNDIEKSQDILSFNFPLNITMEDLQAKAGEPDETNHYESEDSDYVSDELEYFRESELFYGKSRYNFEFVNGALEYLYIEYTP